MQLKLRQNDFEFFGSHWLHWGNAISHRKPSEPAPHTTELCDFYGFHREIYPVFLALVLAESKCCYLQCTSEQNENVKYCKSFKETFTHRISRNFKPEAWVCFDKHLHWISEPLKINLLQWRLCVCFYMTVRGRKRHSLKCLPHWPHEVPITFFWESLVGQMLKD